MGTKLKQRQGASGCMQLSTVVRFSRPCVETQVASTVASTVYRRDSPRRLRALAGCASDRYACSARLGAHGNGQSAARGSRTGKWTE